MKFPDNLLFLRTDKLEIKFCHEVGKVLGEKKWAETHVHSSRAVVANGTAYIPGVSSTVTTRSEIWLKTAQGEEIPLQLTNLDLPVREGQIVSATWAIPAGHNSGPYVLIKNHTTKQACEMLNGIRTAVNSEKRNLGGCLGSICVGGALFAIGMLKSLSWLSWLLIPAAPILAFYIYRKFAKGLAGEIKIVKEHVGLIEKHLDSVAESMATAKESS